MRSESLPFLVYAAAQLALFMVEARILTRGIAQRDPKSYTANRALLALGLFGVVFDNLRLFAGGFWDAASSTPPAFAWSILPLVCMHLVVVPLLVCFQSELCIATATDQAGGARLARLPVLVLALGLAACGAVNAYAEIGATLAAGTLRRTETNGVVQYLTVPLASAKAQGYPSAGPELAGVFAFAWAAVLAGVYVAARSTPPHGWTPARRCAARYGYLVLAIAGLVGQAVGPALGPLYFFYASNFWEIVSFGAMVMYDKLLLSRRTPDGGVVGVQGQSRNALLAEVHDLPGTGLGRA